MEVNHNEEDDYFAFDQQPLINTHGYKKVLFLVFSVHNEKKISLIPQIIEDFAGAEEHLLNKLFQKYNLTLGDLKELCKGGKEELHRWNLQEEAWAREKER